MAESEQIIRLTGRENIHTVRARIENAQAERLLLLVPKGHPALQQLVRMKLLARQAYESRIKIALITKDSNLKDLAHQVELSAFGSVKSARRARKWRKGKPLLLAPSTQEKRQPITTHDLAWQRGRSAVLERKKYIGQQSNWTEYVMLAGFVFGVMIVLSAVLLLLVPSANIILIPRQVPIDLTFPITVAPTAQEIDFANFIIPGLVERQEVQGTFEIATSGRQDVPADYATGNVTFINVTGQPINIPTNTIVSTSTGSSIRFRSTEEASLPSEINARISVPIKAIRPGPLGNVGRQQINRVEGVAATVVRVLNEGETEWGSVQQRSMVTAADREQLRQQLQQRLLQEGRASLENFIIQQGQDKLLLSDLISMEITAENFNGSVGDQLDVLNLELRARISGIVVSQDDIERLAKRELRGEIPENYRMLEDGFSFVPGQAQVIDDGLPVIAVRTQAIAGAELFGEEIRELVRGQPTDEAHAALIQGLPLAADPSILVSPDWWNRMPYVSLRIFIRVGVLGDQAP